MFLLRLWLLLRFRESFNLFFLGLIFNDLLSLILHKCLLHDGFPFYWRWLFGNLALFRLRKFHYLWLHIFMNCQFEFLQVLRHLDKVVLDRHFHCWFLLNWFQKLKFDILIFFSRLRFLGFFRRIPVLLLDFDCIILENCHWSFGCYGSR